MAVIPPFITASIKPGAIQLPATECDTQHKSARQLFSLSSPQLTDVSKMLTTTISTAYNIKNRRQ